MSSIGDVASITLITGVPGNGKTLRAVWYMLQAVKAGDEVYACNVNGLNIDGVTDFPDPTQWEQLPAGSVLVVDEAQRFFRATSGAVPAYIRAMETIRHAGVRLILLTQSPLLIHANIRALVGLHEHLVRQNGKQLATVYRRSRVMDNVRSEKALMAEDHESWAFPKECYDLYKSAEIHTVKYSLSSKAKRGIVLVCLSAALIGYAIWNGKNLFGGDGDQQKASAAATGASATGDAALGLVPGTKDDRPIRYANPKEYAQAHLPRFGAAPWSAQVYDERPVTADPQLYCMSSGQGRDGLGKWQDYSCTCLTEQGTAYTLSQAECRALARLGPAYNPYRQPSQQQNSWASTGEVLSAEQSAPVPGVVVGHSAGKRGDVFPRSPSETVKSWTPPTTTL